MNTKIKVLITLGLFLVSSRVCYAQTEVLNTIKKQMADLAQKNYVLKQEYEEKMRAVYSLQEKVEQKRKEWGALEENYQKRLDRITNRKNNLKYLYKKMDVVQSDILIKKGKIPFLKKKLLDLEKDYDLLNLQLADVKAQKRDLQMKLNDDRFTSQKTEKELSNKIVGLKLKLNTNIDKQKRISDLIITIEENLYSSEGKKKALVYDNQRLQDVIDEIRQKKDIQSHENIILSDKLLLAQKSLRGEITLKKEEKQKISEDLKTLQVQYNDLVQKLDLALRWKEKKMEYHKEMVASDKENADLRKKISELREKLDRLMK